MKNELWNKVLTNNHRFNKNHPEYRKASLLNIILLLLFAVCFYYTITNIIFIMNRTLIILNAITLISAAALLFYFHKTDNIKTGTIITVLLFSTVLLIYLNIAEQNSYALYWICIFPPIVFFLLGGAKAQISIAIFCSYMLIFILTKYKSWEPVKFDIESIFNIIGATFVLILLISYFELSRKEAANNLQNKNNELKENKDHLQLILDSTAEAIYGIDNQGNCTFCNTSCIKILGYQNQDELLGQNMHYKIHHTRRDGSPNPIEECKIFNAFIEGKGTQHDDDILWHADGTYFNAEYSSFPQYKNGQIVGAVVSFKDITERKKDEEKADYLRCHDSLTGLYSRNCFNDFLEITDKSENLPISVVYGDVNVLKLTNDIFGHSAGDTLLKKTADILKKNIRDSDLIFRVGGDEFIILMPKTENEQANEVMLKIKDEMSRQIIAAIKCSISVGCNTKTYENQDIGRTISNAENEMYKDKARNREVVNIDIINNIIQIIHNNNPRTMEHSQSVSEFSREIAIEMNLPETEVRKAQDAGYFHDIGKIILDKNIINKEGILSEDENIEKRQHSIMSYKILSLFDDTLDLADGVYGHHERWDGTGYPKNLKGEEIPIISRIIAVADTYDSLTADTANLSNEKAIVYIREMSGIKFDPRIVHAFMNVLNQKGTPAKRININN